MSRVRIFTRQGDRYSEEALTFLDEMGVPYDEIDITEDLAAEEAMAEAAGGAHGTPQIFIDGEYLGGLEELLEEEAQGRLAVRLASGLEMPSPG
jgi:glutaredoxin 3